VQLTVCAQEEIDKQYSPSVWASAFRQESTGETVTNDDVVNQHVSLCGGGSKAVRERAAADGRLEENVAYGSGPGHTIDLVFPSATAKLEQNAGDGAPVLLYIHGGYWVVMGKEDSCWMADAFTEGAGAIVGAINYDLAPAVTMRDIVTQCRDAVVYAAKRFPNSPIYLAGHSAGGHLAAMMVAEAGLLPVETAQRIGGAVLISGIYDLRPIFRCCVNDEVQMADEAMAVTNSPQMLLADTGAAAAASLFAAAAVPVLVAVGQADSPEFIRQTAEFAATLETSGGFSVEHMVLDGFDHFNIAEQFGDRAHVLTQKALEMMERGKVVRSNM
jgi:arylformamidase